MNHASWLMEMYGSAFIRLLAQGAQGSLKAVTDLTLLPVKAGRVEPLLERPLLEDSRLDGNNSVKVVSAGFVGRLDHFREGALFQQLASWPRQASNMPVKVAVGSAFRDFLAFEFLLFFAPKARLLPVYSFMSSLPYTGASMQRRADR